MRNVSRSPKRPMAPAALLLAATLACAGPLAADTLFRMSGDPGDWISQGQDYLFTPADGSFSGTVNYSGGASINFQGGAHWWYLDFKGPYNRPLAPGVYTGATRYPFAALVSSGLSVSGDGRGCNTLTGTFEVRQVTYGPGNVLSAFWATFEQHCEGGTTAARGEIRFNADTALYVMPPSDLWAMRGQAIQFDLSATDTRGLLPALTASGVPAGASFVDHQDGTGSFAWPAGSPDTATIVLSFHALSPDGRVADGRTVLHVYGDNRFLMSSEPGDYIGGGRDYHYDESNATFRVLTNSQNGVSLNITSGDDWWYLDFSAPGGVPLQTGNYLGATRFPFNGSGPGLDISGNGRGCNTLTGQFVVYDIGYGPGNVLQRFWATFEQHCEGGPAALRGEIKIGGDMPVATSLSLVAAEAQPGRNHLEWYASDAAGLVASVERRDESGGWIERAAVTADGTGHIVYDDEEVTPGVRYGYRLEYEHDGQALRTPETWLASTGLAALRLDGPWPNPARGELNVAFALPAGRTATLELVDLSGRRVLSRSLGLLGPGEHVLRVDGTADLPPGSYWLRLRQGDQVRTRGVILVR